MNEYRYSEIAAAIYDMGYDVDDALAANYVASDGRTPGFRIALPEGDDLLPRLTLELVRQASYGGNTDAALRRVQDLMDSVKVEQRPMGGVFYRFPGWALS